MAIYLVKFVLCSGLLLLTYHLLLKNKTTYQFNRVYLLLSLVFSLAIPLVTVQRSVPALISAQPEIEKLSAMSAEQAPVVKKAYPAYITGNEPDNQVPARVNYTLYIIIGLYSLVALALFVRFIKNAIAISQSAKNNKKLPYRDAWLVLINEKLTPHTFLNYIFINRDDYLNERVENDVLKHELTHARQWHSADVLFIELLQAACWFNPFIFLYRKAIQLNHEFIADAAVISHNNDIAGYQHLLLDKISGLAAPGITCQFNYSVTKKRLVMMTKNTSVKRAMLSRLAVLPVLAVAFILFCTRTQAQQQPHTTTKKQPPVVVQNQPKPVPIPPRIVGADGYPHTTTGVSAELLAEYADITAKYQDKFKVGHQMPEVTPEDREKLETIYKQMNLEQQRKQTICFFYAPPLPPPSSPTQKQLNNWLDPKLYGVWINEKKVDNNELSKYQPDDFSDYFSSRLTPKAIHYKDYKYQVGLMTNAFYKSYRDEKIKNRFKSLIYFRAGNGFKG